MKAAVVTISDTSFRDPSRNRSGPDLADRLRALDWEIGEETVVPDEIPAIQEAVLRFCSHKDIRLLVTTGGTGVSDRDVTPEAIRPLLEKEIPGLGELMRLEGLQSTPFAALSRSFGGVRQQTAILCLPGSVKGSAESLQAVQKLLRHIIDLLDGQTSH